VSYSSGASARQAVPELPDSELLEPRGPREPSDKKILESLQLLWTRRRLLGRIAICSLIASALLALLIPVRYESTARLMPPDNQSGSGLALAAAAMSGAVGGGLSGIASDILGVKNTSDIFVGVLGSRTVQDKLIQQFDLKKLYSVRDMDSARKMLAQRTGISVDRKSQIIFITVTDASPQRAAAIAGAYVDELNRLVSELSTSSARRERIFLESRLQTVNQDLEAAEKNFSQFASRNSTLDIKEQGKAMVEAAATLQGRLIAAESELQGLRQIYADNNVRVRSVRARIDELKNQLNKLGGKGESMTEVSSQPSDFLYPSIRKLPLLGVEYANLYRNTKIQEAVLEALTKEYEMAKVQEAKEIPTVKILDAPNIPDRKSFPPRTLITLLGTALGCCVSVMFVLGSATWNAIDMRDPRKRFVVQIWVDTRAYKPWSSKNGSGIVNGSRTISESERVLSEANDQSEPEDKHS
jgi:capsule polysaccharide export protein KpsE/RkpR